MDADGRLHGWLWSSPVPTAKPHPLEVHLGLQDERIKMIGGKFMRASCVTESGKVRVILGCGYYGWVWLGVMIV